MTQEAEVDSNLAALLRALQFYITEAELTDIQKEILDMKLAKKKNVDIAWDINHKYGKTYTPNYISTIFRQKIIPKINEAAKMHEENIGNIFFPENFKNCTNCGSSLLICPENFMRRARSSDGFATRCKRCEKKIRKGE
jgi:NAD-dependent dihydropyrimidine dehydrogenase PreA subunit